LRGLRIIAIFVVVVVILVVVAVIFVEVGFILLVVVTGMCQGYLEFGEVRFESLVKGYFFI
jgi:hypothetical protein